jgi:hypothetical protein
MRHLLCVALLGASFASPVEAALIQIEFSAVINGGHDYTSDQTLSTNLPFGTAAHGTVVYDTSAALATEESSFGDFSAKRRAANGPAVVKSITLTMSGQQGDTTFSFNGPNPDFPPGDSFPLDHLTYAYAGYFSAGASINEQLSFGASVSCFDLPDGSCTPAADTSVTNPQTGEARPFSFSVQFFRSGSLDAFDLFGLSDIETLDFNVDDFLALPDIGAKAGLIYQTPSGELGSRAFSLTSFAFIRLDAAEVPAPGALALFGFGALALGLRRRR